MNALTRIARALLIVALGFSAPQANVRADESAASRLGNCADQQIFCANVRTPEGRVAIVGARATPEFSLKTARRSSSWQAAVLAAVRAPSAARQSIFAEGHYRLPAITVARSATPVRAPPTSA